jgi:hypothetical protein
MFLAKSLVIYLLTLIGMLNAQSFLSVDLCYENFHTLNDEKSFVEIIERMKTEIKNNQELKRTIQDTPLEFENLSQKLTRCAEELLKKSQFKALEAMIDSVLQPLDIGFAISN